MANSAGVGASVHPTSKHQHVLIDRPIQMHVRESSFMRRLFEHSLLVDEAEELPSADLKIVVVLLQCRVECFVVLRLQSL